MGKTILRRGNSIANGPRRKGLTVLGDIELSQSGRLDAQGTTRLTDHMQWPVLLC